ncbi:MAG: diphosphomevalonate decarboxylase [Calditrichaceae bacterium]
MRVKARANSNIALIKYWGKKNIGLNLPAVGSISLTLNELYTETSVEFKSDLSQDHLVLNGQSASAHDTNRASRFLDIIRKRSNTELYAEVISSNNFPTSAGLASSASGFACLALAGSSAAGLDLTPVQLSELARLGSGSAARSIFGGFVEMKKGRESDGSDSVAEQIAMKNFWDLRLLIAITSEEKKKTGSTDGMILTRNTSPYYGSWIESSENDLVEMRDAIKRRDFEALGELTEYSCLKMHALAMAARPGLIYWNNTTIDLIHFIRDLRKKGVPVYFTIDAGPQVKAVCLPEHVGKVRDEIRKNRGVLRVIETDLGGNAEILGEEY